MAGMATAPDRVSGATDAPRQPRHTRAMSGMPDQEAAGAVLPPARPDPVLDPGLTPAAALTIIQSAYAPSGEPRASVPMAWDLASAGRLERRRAGAERQADRITAPGLADLLAKAGPDRARGGHAWPAAFTRADELLSQKPGGGLAAGTVEFRQDRFSWRAASIEPGATMSAPSRQTAAGGVRDADRFVRPGALIGPADEGPSHHPMPAMPREARRKGQSKAGIGAMIEDTWRRLQRPGGKAAAAAGDAAFSGAAGGGGDSAAVLSAIVTATLAAAAAQLAAREPPGHDPSLPGGLHAPGASPDRPVYTRIVIDQSPIPTMVTNHDVLTNATVSMLAQHQSAMPTAPTELNNSLVPPAPGVPAPGSYHP